MDIQIKLKAKIKKSGPDDDYWDDIYIDLKSGDRDGTIEMQIYPDTNSWSKPEIEIQVSREEITKSITILE